MKKCIGTTLCLLMLCSVAAASPLTDYNQGNTAIDINTYPSLEFHLTNNDGYDKSPQGKSGIYDLGITTGLGNKFAVQYRQFNPETELFNAGREITKIHSRELNVLYQLDKNVAIFAGYHRAKVVDLFEGDKTTVKESKAQFGVTASSLIADKTTLYGAIGLGHDLRNYEIGLSYNVAPNLELNVGYRNVKEKDVQSPTHDEIKANFGYKGIGYGLTYKF